MANTLPLRHLPSLHRWFATLIGLLEFLELHVVTDYIGLHGSLTWVHLLQYRHTEPWLLVLPHLRLLNWFNLLFHSMTEQGSMVISQPALLLATQLQHLKFSDPWLLHHTISRDRNAHFLFPLESTSVPADFPLWSQISLLCLFKYLLLLHLVILWKIHLIRHWNSIFGLNIFFLYFYKCNIYFRKWLWKLVLPRLER